MRQIVLTQTGVGTSAPAPIDIHGRPELAIQTVANGTVNYTVQQTLDDIQDPSVTPTWFPSPVAALVAAVTSQQAEFPFMPSAVRVVVNSGTGSVRMTLLQPGDNRA